MTDPMRPSRNWSQEAAQFAAATGRQSLLCAACVLDGDDTPPTNVVFVKGTTLCPGHARG